MSTASEDPNCDNSVLDPSVGLTDRNYRDVAARGRIVFFPVLDLKADTLHDLQGLRRFMSAVEKRLPQHL